MFSTRTEVKREPCRRCQILRVYLIMVLGLIVFGVMARDLLDQLNGLTPAIFGWAFASMPVLLFGLKYWTYKHKKTTSKTSH